ncbi:MAG: hypothetical protein HGB04_10150 [Chlorobiaceae bacterium]|nr:hypothetical protein [Chlorobiaceae bacterium]
MTTVIVLLCIVILLLAAIIGMMLTGWPGRERSGLDGAEALRREMAEHRSESIRLLNTIRIKVEDSVKESIEREMANYGSRGRSRTTKGKAARDASAQGDTAQPPVEAAAFDEPAAESILAARQLPLFGDKPVASIHDEPAASPAVAAPVPPSPREDEIELVPETIFVGYIDDIPDVE